MNVIQKKASNNIDKMKYSKRVHCLAKMDTELYNGSVIYRLLLYTLEH